MPVSASEKAERRARRQAFVPDPAPIVFVGGTGRSGTHVVARLLSRSDHYGLVPVECRFHTDDDGFPGLLAGEVTKRRFIRRLRGFWWRGFQTKRFRGLHRFVPRERFNRAVKAFDEGFDDDHEGACRRLFLDLLWPVTEGDGGRTAAGIIEQSCDVIAQAPTLVRLFPEARFVHVVRDGRDASASRVTQTRGLVYPRTRRQGLEWWEARIRRIDAGAKAIPEERFLEVELGAFLTRGRREQLRALASLAGIRAGNRLRRFVRRRMSGRAANQARWRKGLDEREQDEIDRLYREALDRLERDGVTCVPLLRNAYERARGT
jgi:Sulfotransferase family